MRFLLLEKPLFMTALMEPLRRGLTDPEHMTDLVIYSKNRSVFFGHHLHHNACTGAKLRNCEFRPRLNKYRSKFNTASFYPVEVC